jgi:tRNA 2-thiocytidine biosynthesis protein TtcA
MGRGNIQVRDKTIVEAIDGLVVKADKVYGLFAPGDRVLVGASGGKDSTVLVHDLARKRDTGRLGFDFAALHVSADFSPGSFSRALEASFASWGVPLIRIDVAVLGRLKPGRKMSCYWCSTQRRTELIRYAMSEGYTKIALGHHMDDILETLLMNMTGKGQLSTMPPLMSYEKYPLSIVRPLALVEERQTRECAEALGVASVTCTCGYGEKSERKKARTRLEVITGGSRSRKLSVMESLSNVRLDYLPKRRTPSL